MASISRRIQRTGIAKKAKEVRVETKAAAKEKMGAARTPNETDEPLHLTSKHACLKSSHGSSRCIASRLGKSSSWASAWLKQNQFSLKNASDAG